jgi:hypothetical protein
VGVGTGNDTKVAPVSVLMQLGCTPVPVQQMQAYLGHL